MMRGALLSILAGLVALPAAAQVASGTQTDTAGRADQGGTVIIAQAAPSVPAQTGTATAPDPGGYGACMSVVLGQPVKATSGNNGYHYLLPGIGRLVARDVSCDGGKFTLTDAVMLKDVLTDGQTIGSAIKSDMITVWAHQEREGCDLTVDYGLEATNFRWFNWNDTTTDGGSKRFEIIRTETGKEARIRTMSHLRASRIIWGPKREDPASPCAVKGEYQVTGLDVRWSRGGTANGMHAESVTGALDLPLLPADARAAQRGPSFSADLFEVRITDITDTDILSARRIRSAADSAQDSALPWAFLTTKYADDLIFRKQDDSLVHRILPMDVANTFYFTRANAKLSMPEVTLTPASLLPALQAYPLSSVSLSKVFSSVEAALALAGSEPGVLKVNARMDGLGLMRTAFGFRTQMFAPALISSVSAGELSVDGRVGPGITEMIVSIKDAGFVTVFSTLMRSKPSVYVLRNASGAIEFWNRVSHWFQRVEAGEDSEIHVKFASPQLLIPGFMNRAQNGAIIMVGEAE